MPPRRTRLGSPFGAIYSQLSRDCTSRTGRPTGRAYPAWALRARSGRRGPLGQSRDVLRPLGGAGLSAAGHGCFARIQSVSDRVGVEPVSWGMDCRRDPAWDALGFGAKTLENRHKHESGRAGRYPGGTAPVCYKRLKLYPSALFLGSLGVRTQSQARAAPQAPLCKPLPISVTWQLRRAGWFSHL